MSNKLSKSGAAFIMLHEGFVSKYYLDPIGVPTIGIGFTWRSTAFRQWWSINKPNQKFDKNATITREEAQDALIFICEKQYSKAVRLFLKQSVAPHVFDGMVSPVYNLGEGSLKWRWAAAIKRGDIETGANILKTTGTTAGGRTLRGLIRRRAEEAHLIKTGVYKGVTYMPYSQAEARTDAMSDGMLRRRERGEDVAKLIKDLNQLGYYDGILDDVFGYGTERAVIAFQKDNNLKADGIAGQKTLEAISNALTPKKKESDWLSIVINFFNSLFKHS